MRHALSLGRRGIGQTSPNPSVGCVIVSPDGCIVGRGCTADNGRPHAEGIALARAGSFARGATAYVTLEPCASQTQTLPCADRLIAAGIKRVVAALEDPDHRTDGNGFAKLRAAGIEVSTGLLKEEARESHAGFLMRVQCNRPLVTLKVAQSSDGKVAPLPGEGQWVTGIEARTFGQLLRARNDAILVGIETILADDPELTCRIPGLEKYSPLRVVLDTKLRLPQTSKLATTAKRHRVIVFTAASGGHDLKAQGVEVVTAQTNSNRQLSVAAVLRSLSERGVTRLLVEGGPKVHASFLNGGYADRLEMFTAPRIVGDRGRSGVATLMPEALREAPNFMRVTERKLGADLLESYAARA